ncbi:MAG: hypothetical protein HYX41_01775 [Bdellovibrio sp.]|nr:hypothetical protein [Bdellovibrio sp.]
MLDRAKVKLRALDSFGISGQLSPEGEVFYTSLFSTKHLGRVSDLLCARLEKSGVDEFKLRFSVLMSVFEAFQGMGSGKGKVKTSMPLAFPLSLEVGVDEEKVVVGIGFTLNPAQSFNAEGLPVRIADGTPNGRLETLLFDLKKNSDLIFIKHDPGSRKVEVVALLAHDGAGTSASIEADHPPLEVLILDQKTAKDAPRPKLYSDLGDLDYPTLLKEDIPGEEEEESHSGEIVAPEGKKRKAEPVVKTKPPSGIGSRLGKIFGLGRKKEAEDEDETQLDVSSEEIDPDQQVEGDDVESQLDSRVKGGRSQKDLTSKVRGSAAEKDRAKQVKGARSEGQDAALVEGGRSENDGATQVKGTGDADQDVARLGASPAEMQDETRLKGQGPEATRTRVKGALGPDEGQTRVRSSPDEEDEEVIVKGWGEDDEGGRTLVKGRPGEKEKRTRVRGKVDEINDEASVSADEVEEPPEYVIIKGAKRKKRPLWRVKRDADEAEEQFRDEVSQEEAPEPEDLSAEPEPPLPQKPRRLRRALLGNAGRAIRNLIGYFRTKEDEEEDSEPSLPTAPPVSKKPPTKKGVEKASETPALEPSDASGQEEELPLGPPPEVPPPQAAEGAEASKDPNATGLEQDAKSLVNELHGGGLDHVLRVAQWESVNIKREIKNQKATKWVENLMGSLMTERARLADLGKKIHGSVRLKEMEFKDKLSVLQEEVRKKEAVLAQKTAALARTKDQLTKVTESNEKLKMIAQNSEEDIHYKQKYDMAQKMLDLAKEENTKFAQRVDELKAQLNTAAASSKATPGVASQMTVLQGKYERLFKQNEEFRKANRQLMEKLNEPRRASLGVEEARKRIEIAMKMLNTEKQEKMALKSQLVTAHQDQIRLRDELKRLQLENKHLTYLAQQQAAKRASGTGGGMGGTGTGGLGGGPSSAA